MGLISWWRGQDPRDYLRQTKTVKIHGVRFKIRRINMEDHLSGLNVMMKLYDTYKVKKPDSKAKQIEDEQEIRKFMRDFIYAGTVHPKISLKKDHPEDELHIDEIIADMKIAEKLCMHILAYSYGKKKLNLKK